MLVLLPQGGSPRDSRGFHQVGEPVNPATFLCELQKSHVS